MDEFGTTPAHSVRHRLELAALFSLGVAPFFLNGLYNPRLARVPAAFWVMDAATGVLLPGAIAWIAHRRGLINRRSLGLDSRLFGRPMPWVIVGLSILLSFVFIEVWEATSRWSYTVFGPPQPIGDFTYRRMIPSPGPDTGLLRLAAVLFMAATAGFIEEFYFRGLLRIVIGDGIVTFPIYVVLSSWVFALAHWESGRPVVIDALFFGIVAAILYRLLDNLWPLIFAHAAVDFVWLM